jgi:AcrR family transcriptional regulator
MSRLSRESIAQAATAIADTDGVDAVSMRRVAAYLGVGTMSLYHHVRDKRGLITAMSDAIMDEQIIPADEVPDGWRAGLAEIGRRAYELFSSHPWILAGWHEADRGEPGISMVHHIEQTLAIVAELDFLTVSERFDLTGLIDEYVVGHAMHTSSVVSAEPGWMSYIEAMAKSGDFPNLAAAFTEAPPETPPEHDFEQGLQIVLDGIERFVEVRRPSARSRPRAGGRAAPSPPQATGPTGRGRAGRRRS